MTAVVQTYQSKARTAADRANSTDDPHLKFMWDQVAASYDDLARMRLKALMAKANSLDGPSLQAGDDEVLRASTTNTAQVCREQAERMCAMALIETNKPMQIVMLALSDQYCRLHDDLLAQERLVSHHADGSADGR